MRQSLWRVPTLLAALALAGCLGGGSDITAVRVAGDSLADGGTFGFKFTVQATPPSRTHIWTDVVADAADVDPLCPRYVGDPTTGQVALRADAASCTSFAVGGGRINVRGTSGDATPYAIPQQLRDMAAAGYGARDIVLVDGGGNDLADLVAAFLAAGSDGAVSYTELLAELLTPTQIAAAAAAGQAGLAQAGGLYMAALADRLVDTIQTQVLDKGVHRVVVINAPDITRTPRFTAVLAAVSASAGEQAAAQVVAAARAWLDAFNGRLAQRLAGNNRVALVDFRGELDKWLNNPSAYGLTNTTTPACPATGTDAQGLPTYNLATCSETVLAANPPAGASASWWNTYVFSDNFHGTPRTNELMGAIVKQTLVARGWL